MGYSLVFSILGLASLGLSAFGGRKLAMVRGLGLIGSLGAFAPLAIEMSLLAIEAASGVLTLAFGAIAFISAGLFIASLWFLIQFLQEILKPSELLRCSSCRQVAPRRARPGQTCPHCGAEWKYVHEPLRG